MFPVVRKMYSPHTLGAILRWQLLEKLFNLSYPARMAHGSSNPCDCLNPYMSREYNNTLADISDCEVVLDRVTNSPMAINHRSIQAHRACCGIDVDHVPELCLWTSSALPEAVVHVAEKH